MVKRSVGCVIVAVSSVAFAWTLRAQDLPINPRASLAAPTNLSEATISIDNRGTALVTDGPATNPSRVLVRFRNGAAPVFLPGSASSMAFPGDGNLHLVNTPPGLSVSETVRRYQANPNVLYAEPDYVVQVDSVPTDPGWNQQWDMVKISAPTAWNTQTDSSSLVVAIIDTGINFKHPDLQANLWTNSDGSHGFTCMRGRCAKGGDDDYGHGTHVAGTIGAAANNGIGIAGLNWHAKLMSVKFLDASGAGSISDAVLAFDQVTALNTTTAGLIDSTGKLLKTQSAAIHEQAASSTIPVETLQRAFQNIYDTMDAIDTFKVKALDSMKTTITTLSGEVEKSKGYIARAEGAAQNQLGGPSETYKLEAL